MRSLRPEPIEIDLYVSSKKMTAKERKELGEFIEEYKRKHPKKTRSEGSDSNRNVILRHR